MDVPHHNSEERKRERERKKNAVIPFQIGRLGAALTLTDKAKKERKKNNIIMLLGRGTLELLLMVVKHSEFTLYVFL